MKIIFLDIDGVLNHNLFYKNSFERRYEEGAIPHPYSEIDPECVSYLNDLCSRTGVKIVISSTWRHSGLEYCKDVLTYHGFTGEIIGITPTSRCGMCVRGNEIQKWIDDNSEMLCGSRIGSNFKQYVILDDDTDMLYWQRNNYIQIDSHCGLTPNNCIKAENILK